MDWYSTRDSCVRSSDTPSLPSEVRLGHKRYDLGDLVGRQRPALELLPLSSRVFVRRGPRREFGGDYDDYSRGKEQQYLPLSSPVGPSDRQ